MLLLTLFFFQASHALGHYLVNNRDGTKLGETIQGAGANAKQTRDAVGAIKEWTDEHL